MMIINFKLSVSLFSIFCLSACCSSDSKSAKVEVASPAVSHTTSHASTFSRKSIDELVELFKQLNYDKAHWSTGHVEIPRVVFSGISENWKDNSKHIPVKLKKELFFKLMTPLILISNEKILVERQQLLAADMTSSEVLALAKKYKVIKKDANQVTPADYEALLKKVDIISPALALAQAAEESGWGTSRFTHEGNAFFGQWDFSGNGMTPKQQRKELGNYGLARFNTPLASVESYMLNINRSKAYADLRAIRAELRKKGQTISGVDLAAGLVKYSERGQAYIDSIKHMIRYNKLNLVDNAYLSSAPEINLRRKYL